MTPAEYIEHPVNVSVPVLAAAASPACGHLAWASIPDPWTGFAAPRGSRTVSETLCSGRVSVKPVLLPPDRSREAVVVSLVKCWDAFVCHMAGWAMIWRCEL